MAKIVPCSRCRDGAARLPDGSVYKLERFPERHGAYTFRCAGCKRTISIKASEFNRLPGEPVSVSGMERAAR